MSNSGGLHRIRVLNDIFKLNDAPFLSLLLKVCFELCPLSGDGGYLLLKDPT
jgi:hypothetical protein